MKLLRSILLLVLAVVVSIGFGAALEPGLVPEVENLRFSSTTDFNWDPLADVDAYNVYRGDLATLPANYGNCFATNLPAPFDQDLTPDPLPGQAFFYLITSNRGAHEGTLGFDSSPLERPNFNPCLTLPPPLLDQINPNGPDLDGVTQGVAAERNPGIGNDLNGLAGGGVYLHTLEYFAEQVDLEIPGRGLNWRHARAYRSQINHDGQQGRNWTFNYDRRVLSIPGGLRHLDGTGRQDDYSLAVAPIFEPNAPGLYNKIRQTTGGFTLRERDGTLYHYFGFNGDPTDGRLESIEDRLGNTIRFLYTPNGLLCNAIDTLGRTINYLWNAQGRLHAVVDYSGREVRYEYDNNGNLISSTKPAVTGTSTGNDFPLGKTTRYRYSPGGGQLGHNLEQIFAPGDLNPVIVNNYNALDELQSQTFGGINSSGVPAGGVSQYAIPVKAGFRTTEVTDRRGVVHVIESDPDGHVLQKTTGPTSVAHGYNSTGERLQTTLPAGNRIEYVYDEFNPDRFQRGNLGRVIRVADAARGDGRGGPLPDIVVQYEYDPLYTQQRLIIDPQGRDSEYFYDYQEGDPALNGVGTLSGDWQILLGGVPLFVGDLNGDGLDDQNFGNPVLFRQPSVLLLPGGRQEAIEGGLLQPITTRYRHNQLGQLVVEIDPENNVDLYEYFPETDPDGDGLTTPAPLDGRVLDPGTGGYLAFKTTDADPIPHLQPFEIARRDNSTNPPPAQILNDYQYDSLGRLTASIDGNGVLTSFEVNALGQIVSVRRGGVSYRSTNLDADPPAGGVFAQQIYNERDEIVSRGVQDLGDLAASGGVIDTEFVYDILGNAVSMTQELGGGNFATTQYVYDPAENRVAVIQPEGNTHTFQYDSRSLLTRLVRGDDDLDAGNGGPPTASQVFYDFDTNGNLAEFIDGNGTTWPFVYDGMDRRVRSEIVSGQSFFDVYYNPDESIGAIRVEDNLGTVLYDGQYGYDELGRVTRLDQAILDQNGFPIPESFDGDHIVSLLTEYDRNSRRTRVINDEGSPRDLDYDGAGRVRRNLDPLGNEVIFEYDANNNVVQLFETELGVVAETFATFNEYDRLNRLVTTTDNAGNQKSQVYDSRDNLIALTDALGNTISYTYDATNRRSAIIRDMRVDGTGGSAVFDQAVNRFEYDFNGRVTAMIDANGNPTSYGYDDLNRKIFDSYADGSTTQYGYDANDNVTRMIDANGSVIDVIYDAADRPTNRFVAPAPGVHGSSQSYTYDAVNRLTQAIDQNAFGAPETTTVDLVYDSLNRIRVERTQFGFNPPRFADFTYDGNNNRATANYPSGGSMTYAYDPLGRLAEQFDGATGFFNAYDYLGPERMVERHHGNGTRKSYLDPAGAVNIGYDGLRRQVNIAHYHPANFSLAEFNYDYDPIGNILREKRDHSGFEDTYRYDSLYRVVEYERDLGSATPTQVVYTLDKVGNWLERLINGVPFGNTPNNLNEYGEKPDDGVGDDFNDNLTIPGPDGVNLGYDLNGDLITEGPRSYEYDALHRLVLVRDGGAPLAHYVYDGLNRRIAKVNLATGDGHRYIYDGDAIVEELQIFGGTNEGPLERRFYPGIQTEIVAMELSGAGVFYLHDDVRGSLTMVSDAAANVVERITYDAFGEPRFEDALNNPTGATDSAFTPFLYQGRYWDPETRLYERRGGYFAPRLGRHIQRHVPGEHLGPMAEILRVPMLFPCPVNWMGMNPFWWNKGWFWHPAAWNFGWWAWMPFWWFGGAWGWWWWRPWLWFGGGPFLGWWVIKPWFYWWCTPFNWWGWQTWWSWGSWWGWWPFWGWLGWRNWLPYWGYLSWHGWWPFWNWSSWWGWWPSFGWWGWCGWWPWWNVWWDWHPYWWWGWWTWSPWWWFGYWGWSGLYHWYGWWNWITWWPWAWWNWAGWWWWGFVGWNPWWYYGWWGWWSWGWMRGFHWWWGPMGWWGWFGWGWVPWWWIGWWAWLWPWGWWNWGWWGWGWNWFGWWWLRAWWGWPWWGWYMWWGWWWPWWGWWG